MDNNQMTSHAKSATFTFVWKIENVVESLRFLYVTWLESPTFITKYPFLVEWSLKVQRSATEKESFLICLKTGRAIFPTFLFDYEITVYGRDGQLLHTSKDCSVKASYPCSETPNIGPIKYPQACNLKGDNCIVQCDVTIHPDQNSAAKQDLLALSADLSRLFEKGELSDLELSCGKRTFPVHKCVLLARAPKLAEQFGIFEYETSSPPTVKVRIMKSTVLSCLLSYFYSGRVTTQNPAVLRRLEGIAKRFEIFDLERIIYPSIRKYVACTKVPSEKFTFRWPIKNIGSVGKNLDQFYINACITNCKLIVSLKKQRKKNKIVAINISLRKTSSKNYILAIVRIKAIDGEGTFHPVVDEQCCKITKKEESLVVRASFQDLVKKKEIERLLKNDVLILDCVVILREELFTSQIEEKEFSLPSTTPRMENVWGLGADILTSFYRTFDFREELTCLTKRSFSSMCEFSEPFLTTMVKVDKAILWARSPVLGDIAENNTVLDIQHTDYCTLKIFLEYIYGSSYDARTLSRWKEMFSFAKRFAIPSLRQRCVHHMLENLSDGTVVEVLKLADEYDDGPLKAEATEYICTHAETVLKSPDWNELKRTKPDISTKIVALLPDAVRERLIIY